MKVLWLLAGVDLDAVEGGDVEARVEKIVVECEHARDDRVVVKLPTPANSQYHLALSIYWQTYLLSRE